MKNKKINFVIIISVIIILAWAPWIRSSKFRQYFIENGHCNNFVEDYGCAYIDTDANSIKHYPFFTIVYTQAIISGWPFGERLPIKLVFTPFGVIQIKNQ